MKKTHPSRRWLASLLGASLLAASLSPAPAHAGICDWLTGKPAAQPIPYGPPVFTPNPNPPVVGWGPAVPVTGTVAPATNFAPSTGVPSTGVPAASIPPTLNAPPANFAPSAGIRANFAPATATAACPTCVQGTGVVPPTPVVTNYTPPNYRTTWVQVPVTTYRPVMTVDPATGLPVNGVQPCTTMQWQARRVPNSLLGNLWPSSAPPAVAVAPVPVVTNYVPQGVIGNVPAPVVTNYAPAPGVIGNVPGTAPVVTNFAPAAPSGCSTGRCPTNACPSAVQVAPSAAPYATFPTTPSTSAPLATPLPGTPLPSNTVPSTRAPSLPSTTFPSTTAPGGPGTTISPSPSRTLGNPVVPADRPPTLNPSDLNRGALVPSTRNYTPAETPERVITEQDALPLVPVTPPADQIQLPPPPVVDPQGSNQPIRSPGFMPLGRSTEKPASTKSGSPLRLVPDPEAQPLELRKNDIPQLINPNDRTTLNQPAPRSVPVSWPAKTTVAKPVVADRDLPLAAPQSKTPPAALPTETLDDGGWKSVR